MRQQVEGHAELTGHIPGATVLRRHHATVTGPSRGSNHVGLRAANERLVLSLIRSHGQLSKAQIAELSGLTAQTASVIARSLVEAGLLHAGAPVKGKVGQPFVPLTLNPNGAIFFGLNVEATETQLALVDFTGNIVSEQRLAYASFDPGETARFAGQAVQRARRSFRGDREQRLQGIGVSMGASIDPGAEGNRAWSRFEETVAMLEQTTGLPVYRSGYAAAACGAELIYGLGSGVSDFLYVFVDHTVSGGLVLNGRIRFSTDDAGPNIGRMLVPSGRGEMVSLASLAPVPEDNGVVCREAVEQLARGIAHAAHGAVSALGCDTVIIDGSVPPDVVHQISLAARASLVELSGDTAPPTVREGSRWRKAIPLGAACLPLVDRFFPEAPVR